MANKDNPSGFAPMAVNPTTGSYLVAVGQTISTGDLVSLDSDGKAILATATSTELLGVAAYAGTAGANIAVYDDPECEFVGQCSGNFARNMIGTECDIEGTTGIQEANENAHVKNVIRIQGYIPSDEIGANTRVVVRISKHAMGESPTGPLVTDTAGTHTGDVVADEIAEHTEAHGVEIDGVLCKDNGVQASGGLGVSVTAGWGMSPTGNLGAATIRAGTNVATAPEFEVSATGEVTAAAYNIGPNGGPAVAGVDATGAASFVTLGVGPVGAAVASFDAAGVLTTPGLVLSTAEFLPASDLRIGADFALDATGPGATLAAEKTGATLLAFAPVAEGRTLTSWKASGLFTQAAALSATGRLYKRTIAAGAYVDATVDAAVTFTEADGAITATQILATPEVAAAGAAYYLLITATTGVGDTCSISDVMFGVK